MIRLYQQTGILSLILSFFTIANYAQDIRFKHLTINDGLSQNVILSMARDNDGFMWFGTKDGLNKYDGYQFVVYQNEPNNKNSLSSNYITALFKDTYGKLWVGTYDGMLHLYHKDTQIFERIPLPLAVSENNNDQEISTITQDQSGSIWIGTNGNGVFKLPYVNKIYSYKRIKQYSNVANRKYNLLSNIIKKLHVDDQNILWIGTHLGLNKMNIQNEQFSSFRFDVKHPDAPKSSQDFCVSSIIKADKNRLWIGTRSGLIKFNTQSHHYDFYAHTLSLQRYGWGDINSIVADKQGFLWLGTPGELMRFDTKKLVYKTIKNDQLNPETLSYNVVSSLFIDRTNILWVGTSGMGIDYYDAKANRFELLNRKDKGKSRITAFSIRSLMEENERFLWISTGVLYRWDRKTGELKSFETNSTRLNDFGNTGVASMIKTKDNRLWFGCTEGLFTYDPKTEKAIQFKYDSKNTNGIPDKNVITVFEDKNQVLWIVTENFLSKMVDRNKGVFVHYRYNNTFNTFNRCVIYEDINEQLWMGTKDGLLVFNKQKSSFHTFKNDPELSNSLINNQVNTICPDPLNPNQYLWIGTSGGLNQFNIKNKTFTAFTQKDGLPNNVIYGILPDAQNNLWMSTNKGLSKYNLKTKRFRNYDVADGLQSNEFNTGAFLKSNSGELFFGGISGLNHFFPQQITDNPFSPPISITSIKVYSQSNKKHEGTQIRKLQLNIKDEITFSHRDEIIIFEFAALDFAAPKKNKYAYKLEGLNENWINTDNSRSATFTNLPPGKYTLKVKGSNNDGIWNQKGIAISIQVLPHWTATWWAYILYSILILVLLNYFRIYEKKRIKIKNDLKLEHQEFDTLKVLDQMKSRFFTNISHEFRTPLTLINGYTENLMNVFPSNTANKQLLAIDQNAKTLLKLINELLDISKLESGEMVLKYTQQNIVFYLKNIFYSVESFSDLKNISLNFISDDEEIQMAFDTEKMNTIILNLISNALKFTPENGKITFTIQRQNENQITICICDNGIGIATEYLPHIFNRFYQADNSDTRMYEGSGIGLALAKELIELHKGTISAHRNEELTGENGTTFRIKLPIGEISNTNLVQPEQSNQPELQSKIPIDFILKDAIELPDFDNSKKIVVLVDDNLIIRTFIKAILKTNYKIVEAADGLEGIELAKTIIPDIIITDVMMPKLDGISMVQQLRNDDKTSHIPIIMLSGKAALEDKLTGLEAGIESYLTKPFSVKELQLIIHNLIHKRELLRSKYQNKFVVSTDEIPLESVDQQFLEKVILHIKTNIENTNYSVEQLGEHMHMSSSQLHRKLHALLNQAPGQLIRNIRLQRAADLIKQNAGSLAEICYLTGFNDQTYFSRAFKNQFGCSPSTYKKNRITPIL